MMEALRKAQAEIARKVTDFHKELNDKLIEGIKLYPILLELEEMENRDKDNWRTLLYTDHMIKNHVVNLPKIRKALGGAALKIDCKSVWDSKDGIIKVFLNIEGFQHHRLSYLHKSTDSDRCRIEQITTTYSSVVCKPIK